MNQFDKVFRHLRTTTNIKSPRDLALVIGEPLQDILEGKRKGVFLMKWLLKIAVLRPGSLNGLDIDKVIHK